VRDASAVILGGRAMNDHIILVRASGVIPARRQPAHQQPALEGKFSYCNFTDDIGGAK
jgi:hypothetical protein